MKDVSIKFLKDCYDYDYAPTCDRDVCDEKVYDSIETLALVCEDRKMIYDYGASISFSDHFNHTLYVSNDNMNHLFVHFGKLFLAEYSDLKCLSEFFNDFINEL